MTERRGGGSLPAAGGMVVRCRCSVATYTHQWCCCHHSFSPQLVLHPPRRGENWRKGGGVARLAGVAEVGG